MTLLEEPIGVTLRIVRALEALAIPYVVGGSLASSIHGRPRATQDVDIVAGVLAHHVAPFVADLEQEFYVDADMIQDAIGRNASFNVIHLGTMLKVDVFVLGDDELAQCEMDRRVAAKLRGQSVWFASPEDIILQKLVWYEKGSRISERQWRDVLGVIDVQGEHLDVAYIRAWSDRLGLRTLWEAALEAASPPPG